MKLENIKMTGVAKMRKAKGIRDSVKIKRDIARFFSVNYFLVFIGYLFAESGLAEVLAEGRSFELPDTLEVDGMTFPFAAGQVISLKTMQDTWGCLACNSAHGSGIGRSTSVNSERLETVKCYWSPVTHRFHTISDTCLDTYFKAHSARVLDVMDYRAELSNPESLVSTTVKLLATPATVATTEPVAISEPLVDPSATTEPKLKRKAS